MGHGVEIIRRIANEKGLFRERDVKEAGASPTCLRDALVFGFARPHGHGVWSHPKYEPTRYELVQIRMEKAVFWGPSALWLLGVEETEPEVIWIALGNNFPRPRTLEHGTVVIRSRNFEKDLTIVRQGRSLLDLRVQSRELAEADVARNDCRRLADRDLRPRFFTLDPDACLLSAQLAGRWPWRPPHLPPAGYEDEEPEHWSVANSVSWSAPAPHWRLRRRRS